jgi:ABC-type bacteriocin/lantibiotic exporter with double-glycine peptidase domain
MRYDVPFRRQESSLECGPTALQMASAFLGDEKGLEAIRDLLDFPDNAVYTIQLATTACELGFKADFYTSDLQNEHDEEYYEENAKEISNEELNSKARDVGVEIREKQLELDELFDLLDEDRIPIVLLDWNRIQDEEGYLGHFVVLTGYTESKAIIHNPDSGEGDYVKINREAFDEARKAEGTDQDLAVIKKKEGS